MLPKRAVLKPPARVSDRAARARRTEETELRDPSRWLLRSPAWAAAAALHLVAAVVLMNIVHFVRKPADGAIFRVSFRPPARPEPPGGLRRGDQDNGINGRDGEDAPPAGAPDPADPHPAGVRADLPKSLPLLQSTAPAGVAPLPGLGISGKHGLGGVFAGRGGAGRGEALRRHGGGEDTERGVTLGLEWLARHQAQDGSWGTSRSPCAEPKACTGLACSYPTAVTGLALLAFLGSGHTHMDGPGAPYARHVRLARDFLLARQGDDGGFLEGEGNAIWPGGSFLYSHGIATLALAELLALTQDPELRAPVTRAVQLIAEAQQGCGGWNYCNDDTGRGDGSVSTWIVQALRAARLAGVPVPRRTWDATARFYARLRHDEPAGYAYDITPQQVGQRWGGTEGLAAAGRVACHLLETPPPAEFDVRLAARLLNCPPVGSKRVPAKPISSYYSHYTTYYTTLGLFYLGGASWAAWNAELKPALLGTQLRSGDAAGSWPVDGTDASGVGRAYATALGVLDLEVYYRYLPSAARGAADMAPLADLPGDTSEDLLAGLRSPDMARRYRSARELCRRGEPAAAAAISEAIAAEKTSLRPCLIEALGRLPLTEETWEVLLAHAGGKDAADAEAAIRGLQAATGASLTTAAQFRNWRDGVWKKRAAERK